MVKKDIPMKKTLRLLTAGTLKLTIMVLAAYSLNSWADVSQSSVITPPSPTPRTKCQHWSINTTALVKNTRNVPIKDPADSKNYGGGGTVDIGTCLFSLPVIGCIIPVIPPPWVGAPFYSDGWEKRCPPDRPYMKSFDETWAAWFTGGGHAWTDNFVCTAAPNQVTSKSVNVWVQDCDTDWTP